MPFIRPPWVLDSTDTPDEVAIMAPDSVRSFSPGSRLTRAAAKEGLWRSSTFMVVRVTLGSVESSGG